MASCIVGSLVSQKTFLVSIKEFNPETATHLQHSQISLFKSSGLRIRAPAVLKDVSLACLVPGKRTLDARVGINSIPCLTSLGGSETRLPLTTAISSAAKVQAS